MYVLSNTQRMQIAPATFNRFFNLVSSDNSLKNQIGHFTWKIVVTSDQINPTNSVCVFLTLSSSRPLLSMLLLVSTFHNFSSSIFSASFRYDNREGSHSHWSDDSVLKGRGLFLSKYSPARLTIENVNFADQSVYKCRVDFKIAPTSISSITLQVIGKYQS